MPQKAKGKKMQLSADSPQSVLTTARREKLRPSLESFMRDMT